MHVVGPPSATNVQAGWPSSNGALIPASSSPNGTIALNTLIDYIVHKTYHDIVVMADLLPGKSDMEKKIDIARFANRTRQLMIRLLAVVKWSGSVLKVMKCEEITQLLDQQALLFIDTADKLHTLANQLVVQARLPNFAIPAAVDVLTTGTYPRLPNAIRNKIIPPDPITSLEKSATLKRLNEIIMHRLVTTKIPLQIADLVISEGRARLFVPGEFKASLTLMGEADDVSWRLLKLKFMIKDNDTTGGHALVHGLQISYIHELVQSRLIANENPLQDIYNVVHSFCLSLKIEVLQAQAARLIQKRWGRLVQIDEYQPGVKVVLSYWRLTPSKAKQGPMTIVVYQSSKDDHCCLGIGHIPPLHMENADLVERAMNIDDLSFERLLSDTISVRSFQKLYDLHHILQKHIKNDSSEISEDNSCLGIPLIRPHEANEYLSISIDPQTGAYIPSLPAISLQVLDRIEKAINESPINLLSHIPMLRKFLAKEQCNAVIQSLPAVGLENLFLENKNTHAIGNLSDDLVFIKLKNFTHYYVVVELIDSELDPTAVFYHYYLLSVSTMCNKQGLSRQFKADMLMRLDCFTGDTLQDCNEEDHIKSELAQIVSICDTRIPFINLAHDLTKDGLSHQGILQEGSGIGLCIKLVTFPEIPAGCVGPLVKQTFLSSLVDCSFRLLDKSSKMAEASGSKCWHADLVFNKRPLETEAANDDLTLVSLNLDFAGVSTTLNAFKAVWASMLHLYGPVSQFAHELENEDSYLHEMVSVRSYDFRTLLLRYGKNKELLVGIKWSGQSEKFTLSFGRYNSSASNSHSFAMHYFNNLFNTDPDIGKLVQVLHDTSRPLQALCSLSSVPLIGMTFNQSTVTQQNAKSVSESFAVVIQTVSHYRLIYRSTFCLDIYCLPSKVALRDGSLSKFQSTEVKEALQPIPGLKSFLSEFEHDGFHLRSAAEKDNPPLVDVQNAMGSDYADPKTLPQGVWAGSNPTFLDQEAFTMMLSEEQSASNHYQSMSVLEQFMGLTLLRRELERIIHSPTQDSYYFPSPSIMSNVPANDALTTFFAANSLMFRVTMQFLQRRPVLAFNVQQVPPLLLQERGLPHGDWRANMLSILEQFFKVRVACPPYRPSNVHAFCNIISSKSVVLTDFISVMLLELSSHHQNDPNVKWVPQICLTVPPRLSYAPSGVPAVYIKDKILIFVLMTMKNHSNPPRSGIIMPIVWYPQTNITTLPGRNNPLLTRIDAHLKQWMERRLPNTECQMSGAVKYLMDNFAIQ